MNITWNDKDPIYRQIHDRIVELILDRVYVEGEALPSIRELSSQLRINHITVSKALQMLVDEELVEKRRGLGMYVLPEARVRLIEAEKQKFINDEWPLICEKLNRLGLSLDTLRDSSKIKEEKSS